MLQLFATHGLHVNASKCLLSQDTCIYLGFEISQSGIRPHNARVKALLDIPQPSDVKELRTALGAFGYLRPHIKNFASIARPLYDLTKSNVEWIWTGTQDTAFMKLKSAITSEEVLLLFPDFNHPFTIYVDASDIGYGAVLGQFNANAVYHPVEYTSGTWSQAEINYSVSDREALAILNAVRKWDQYLIGGPRFTVFTDHMPNISVMTSDKRAFSRRTRIAEELSIYNFEILHVRGIDNGIADLLSRHPVTAAVSKYEMPSVTPLVSSSENSGIFTDELKAAQRKDANLGIVPQYLSGTDDSHSGDDQLSLLFKSSIQALKLPSRPFLHDGLVCTHDNGKYSTARVIVPLSLRQRILAGAHFGVHQAHLGVQRSYKKLAERFIWSGCYSDLVSFIDACEVCQRYKRGPVPKLPGEHVFSGGVNDLVSIDAMGPISESDPGNSYIVVIMDLFSRWSTAIATRDIKAETMASVFIEHWLSIFGPPNAILSDRGRGSRTSEWILSYTDLNDYCQ